MPISGQGLDVHLCATLAHRVRQGHRANAQRAGACFLPPVTTERASEINSLIPDGSTQASGAHSGLRVTTTQRRINVALSIWGSRWNANSPVVRLSISHVRDSMHQDPLLAELRTSVDATLFAAYDSLGSRCRGNVASLGLELRHDAEWRCSIGYLPCTRNRSPRFCPQRGRSTDSPVSVLPLSRGMNTLAPQESVIGPDGGRCRASRGRAARFDIDRAGSLWLNAALAAQEWQFNEVV
jgi:hypothetical protein